jgi:hypothetical protein
MNHVIMANHMISLITSSTTDPSLEVLAQIDTSHKLKSVYHINYSNNLQLHFHIWFLTKLFLKNFLIVAFVEL